MTGHVLDDGGAPVPDARVSATCYPIALDGFAGTACPGEQISDASGAFVFTAAGPGTTTLESATVTAQTVAIGTDTDVNLRFAPALLDGRLVASDSGLPDVDLCFQESLVSTCVTTDADGRFQVTLPPGTYEVIGQTLRDNSFVSVDFPRFAVSSAPIILQTPSVRQLAGRLVDLDGQPIVAASVCVICQSATSGDLNESFCGSSTLTDGTGGFSWPSLEGSQQDLEFQLPGDPGAPWISVDDVTAGGTATFVTIAIQPPVAASHAPTSGR